MKKKLFCSMLAVLVFALWVPAQAQQPAKLPKIGWLSGRLPSSSALGTESFLLELGKLGYVEGKNFAIEHRYSENKLDQLTALAEELVGLKPDVLVVSSTPAVLALKNAAKTTIPIVFYNVTDPMAAGLVHSLARPGGSITGITDFTAVLAGKRLELLKETIPKLVRVALLWNPQDPASAQQWKESQQVARELGLQLYSMEVGSADGYESAFKAATKARSAALAVTDHVLGNTNQKQIVDLARRNRLPAIYGRGRVVQNGGLMSYAADRAEPYRRVAVFVDKILKGTKPADIPVEQPMKFEFIVNLKAAKQIGLTIPPNVLVRAGKVIR